MIRVFSQNFMDELSDVDWGDNPPEHTPGFINDSNYQDYLADDLQEDSSISPTQITEDETTWQEYDDANQLVNDGIDSMNVVSFDYTTRHGTYIGQRTVEPHYLFVANSTGNLILVAWDLGHSEIRAFIVGNIHPFGVRYKNMTFQPRSEIMSGVAL